MTDEFEKRKKVLHAPIFYEAGVALYDCQWFEQCMADLLVQLSRLGVSGLDLTRCLAISEGDVKKTAGQLAKMLRENLCISEGLEEKLAKALEARNRPIHPYLIGLEEKLEGLEDKLAKALEARNRLIHRYLIENAKRFFEIREHKVLVKEIRALRLAVRRSLEQLDPIVRALDETIDGVPFDARAAEVREKFLRDTRGL